MRYPACFGETFPLLCKEGPGEVESSTELPVLHGRGTLPHLPSPYKGEEARTIQQRSPAPRDLPSLDKGEARTLSDSPPL